MYVNGKNCVVLNVMDFNQIIAPKMAMFRNSIFGNASVPAAQLGERWTSDQPVVFVSLRRSLFAPEWDGMRPVTGGALAASWRLWAWRTVSEYVCTLNFRL